MGNRKGIVYAAIERLDQLMAIGESRYVAKQQRRAASEQKLWTVTTGKIHAHTTRVVYQQHVLAFINWTRSQYGIKRLEELDIRADELVSRYLTEHIEAGKSAYTLQTERAALRLFFGHAQLADAIMLPLRHRTMITRSRGEKAHDRHFQPAHWPALVQFAQATGLRRSELRDLRIRDVTVNAQGALEVLVRNGKGGRSRVVPVLPTYQQQVYEIIQNRHHDEHLFAQIPTHMDVHAYRRAYAQTLYLHYAPQQQLPLPAGRLKSTDYDRNAAEKVSQALGHNRVSIALAHYLR